MMHVIDTIVSLGTSSIEWFWLPLLTWTILWLIAEVVLRLVPGGHPMIRYRVNQALLVSLPVALLAASMLDISHLLPAPPPIILEAVPIQLSEGATATDASALQTDAAPLPSTPILPLIAGIGFILAILLSSVATLRLVIQVIRLGRFRRRIDSFSRSLDANHLQVEGRSFGRTRMLECALDVVPMTYGLLRPTIVVPAALSDIEKRLAIEHELEHVRHFDFAGRLAELTTQALFFFHPATTILARQCELFREMTCDAMLTSHNIDVSAYAKLLYRYAAPPAQPIAVTVSMADSRSHITIRLAAMRTTKHTSSKPYASAIGSALAVLIVVSMAASAPFAFAQRSPEIDFSELERAELITPSEQETGRLMLPEASASIMLPAQWAVRLHSASDSEGEAFAMLYHVGDASEEGQGRFVAVAREDCVSWQNKLESFRQDNTYGARVRPAPEVRSWMDGAEGFHATLSEFRHYSFFARQNEYCYVIHAGAPSAAFEAQQATLAQVVRSVLLATD